MRASLTTERFHKYRNLSCSLSTPARRFRRSHQSCHTDLSYSTLSFPRVCAAARIIPLLLALVPLRLDQCSPLHVSPVF